MLAFVLTRTYPTNEGLWEGKYYGIMTDGAAIVQKCRNHGK